MRTHVYKNATCTKPKICKFCGSTKGKKLGHKWKQEAASEIKVCSRCKKRVPLQKEDKSESAYIDVYAKLKKLQQKYRRIKIVINSNGEINLIVITVALHLLPSAVTICFLDMI